MTIILDNDPIWEEPIEAPTDAGDTFSIVRTLLQKVTRRTAWLREVIARGVPRIRRGSVAEMRAIEDPTTGDVFIAGLLGIYVFDGLSIAAPSAPWAYPADKTGFGAGHWQHFLQHLQGNANGGLASLLANGKVDPRQVPNALIARGEWVSTTLAETISSGGYTDVMGAVLELGACELGDLVFAEASFGSVTAQVRAGGISAGSHMRLVIYEAASPSSLVEVLSNVAVGRTDGEICLLTAFEIPAEGSYTLKVQVAVGVDINADATSLVFAGMGRLAARRFR